MDALRLPPGDADVTTLSGGERRRVALCRLLLVQARPAPARRAHQPPRRRVGGLARAHAAGVPRHRGRRHPRPLLPRQRGRLDPRARPGSGHPLGGQLLLLARAEAGPAGRRGARPITSRQDALAARARVDPDVAAGPPVPRARPVSTPTTSWWPRPRRPSDAPTSSRSPSRPAPGSATGSSTRTGLVKGFGDRLLIDELSFLLPPGGIVGVIGPERRRQDDAVPDDRRRGASPTAGSSTIGTDGGSWPTSTSPATQLDPDATVFDEITGGVDRIVVGNRELHGRAYVASFGFTGQRPAEEGR